MRNNRSSNDNRKSGERGIDSVRNKMLKRKALDVAVAAAFASVIVVPASAQSTYTVTSGPFSNGSYQNMIVPAGVTVQGGAGISFISGSPATSLINNGALVATLGGTSEALEVSGPIATITNNGSMTADFAVRIMANAPVGLINNGLISGGRIGVLNFSSALNFTNSASGTIRAPGDASYPYAFVNNGYVATLDNSGTIAGTNGAIFSYGTIGTLNNNAGGVIRAGGTDAAIASSLESFNASGTIGAINNSGTIIGIGAKGAIYSSLNGKIGAINNSGMIAGSILNVSSNGLTINGGSGGVFGTLTGIGSVGTISSPTTDLTFGSGNLVVQDNIGVGAKSVINAGATLRLTDPILITGNYVQNAGGTTQFQVGGGGAGGRLTVAGNTTLATGSNVVLLPQTSYALAKGQRYVVIRTTGTAAYNEAGLNYSAIGYTSGKVLGAAVTDSSSIGTRDLVLTLAGADGSTTPDNGAGGGGGGGSDSKGLTDAGKGVTDALQKYPGTNSDILNIANAVDALPTTKDVNKAAEVLSPAAVTQSAVAVTSAATNAVIGLATTHLDNLRGGMGGDSDSLGASGSGDGKGNGKDGRTGGRDQALWGQLFGGHVNQGDRDDVSGFHANYGGLVIGGDSKLNDNVRAGGLVSYARIKASSDGNSDGSSANVDSYGLFAYGDYTGDPWYLTLMAGVSKQRYNTTRLIKFPGFYGVADGSFNGLQMTTAAQLGYPLTIAPGTRLTPLVGAVYSAQRQNGYTEGGGNGAALSVDASSATSLKSDIGFKVDQTVDTAYGKVQPSVQLRWRHEFHNARLRTVGAFAADTTGTTGFTSYGPTPIKNTALLVLGGTLLSDRNFTLSANYSLEAAEGYRAHAGDVRMRWQF